MPLANTSSSFRSCAAASTRVSPAKFMPNFSSSQRSPTFLSPSFTSTNTEEALRLYPQLPVNVRFAARTTLLPQGGGPDGASPVLLRKGTGVGWSTYHMHRLESLYGPDARVYRPDRWEDGKLIRKVGLGTGFLDFHGGPRVCLGSKLILYNPSPLLLLISPPDAD